MLMAPHNHNDERTWRALKALGNPVRLLIVRYIHDHPYCICNEILLHLPDDCPRAQSTLSQHLKILRDAGLIEAECDGSATCYVLNQECFDWLREQLADMVEEGDAEYPPGRVVTAEEIAATILATVQGGYVLARASGSPAAFDAGVRGLLALLRPTS